MKITIQDMQNLAIESSFNCYIYNLKTQKIIFEGEIDDIPDELLENEIETWEIYNNKIGFNVYI